MSAQLILLRHGESEWNAKNLFTGWVDVDINEKGLREAEKAAELLKSENLLPEVLHTSLLRRAIHTAQVALDGCDRHWIPVRRSWRLNERHYGKLQGLNKAEIREQFGEDQFMQWRRSYDTPPPALDKDNEFSQWDDVRYADIPRGRASGDRVPQGRRGADAAVLGGRDRAGSAGRQGRAGGRARQLAAGAGQAPGPDLRRRHLGG